MADKYPNKPGRKSRTAPTITPRRPSDKMTAQERADLIARLRAKGFKAGTVNAIIKASKTRAEIARELAAIMAEAGTL